MCESPAIIMALAVHTSKRHRFSCSGCSERSIHISRKILIPFESVTHRTTCDDWNESAVIAAIPLEVILQESSQVLFLGERLPHGLRERSSRCLSNTTQLHDFILALKDSHFVKNGAQRLDLAVVDNLFELFGSSRRTVEVSMQG